MPQERTHKRIYWLLAIAALVLVAFFIWLWGFLRPTTWRYYTDDVSTRRLVKDVTPRFVLWEKAQALEGDVNVPSADLQEPCISPDGTKLVFMRGLTSGNANLYMARWDGKAWSGAEPLRALNSKFNEKSPAFSHDGHLLFFSTDRPGGMGGYDIWVARWDGAEYAWPEPLGRMVNSPFDDFAPQPSGDDRKLYFSSNRPRTLLVKEDDKLSLKDLRQKYAGADFDIYSADCFPVGYTNRAVERATSLLYSLRQSALTDPVVMEKLGGTKETEAAVDRALEWLAQSQDTNGCWVISKFGGAGGHDVASTSVALLTFFGRGERHDKPGKYQEKVAKGVKWLLATQNKLTGDLRGPNPTSQAMYDQGLGTLALAEAYGLTKDPDLFEAAQSAVYFITDAQNDTDGGWRYVPKSADSDLSVSGWMIMALESAKMSGIHVPEKNFEGIRKFLASVSTGSNGGLYSYTPKAGPGSSAMNATGFFCSQLMGLSANTPRAFETGAFLVKTPLSVEDVYYSYYGTLSAYQNQGPTWREWNTQLKTKILALQQPDGSWNAAGGFGAQMGKVVTTGLLALSLESHYRYTPLYGLGFEPSDDPAKFSTWHADQIRPVPEYDRAKLVPELNSSSDDLYVSSSGHGDFLYFSSNREDGLGGFDIYRAHVGPNGIEPSANLGPAINSASDDTTPAVNMAGFQLVFSSNRGLEKGKYQLQSSTSRIVHQRYSYTRPDLGWVWKNYKLPLFIALVGLLVLIASLVQINRKKRLQPTTGREES